MVSFFFSFSVFVVSLFLRSVIRFSYLSASPFLSPLPLLFLYNFYSSAVCILRGSSVCWRFAFSGLSLLPLLHQPFLRLLPLRSLSFFSSCLPPIPFFISFLLPSLLLLPWFSLSLSLSFSFSCLFSLLGNAALQCCLSVLVHLLLWYSVRMLRLRFLCAGVGVGVSPALFVFCDSTGGYSVVCLFQPPGYLLSPFRFAFGVSLPFGLCLAFVCLLRCPLLTSLLRFSFYYRSLPLRLLYNYPVFF